MVESNPLDGCVYLYLDMGTNIGVQIRWTFYTILNFFMSKHYFFRKLFEHQKFPDAAINDIFQKYFFSNNNTDIDNLEVRREQKKFKNKLLKCKY